MRQTTITVPHPCAESWAAMTPASGGRHCAACAKTVVDFTHKTDAEILAYLARTAGNSCGRFRADQLARPLHPAVPVSRWRSWLASALALGGVLHAGRSAGQVPYHAGGPEPAAVGPGGAAGVTATPATAVPLAATDAATKPGGSALVSGIVLDSNGPVLGVTVLVMGTNIGAATNADGSFTLPVEVASGHILTISSVGYVTQQVTANSVQAGQPLVVHLEQEISGAFVCVLPPAPWHPRRLYYWGRYWLTRPFR